MKLLAVVLFAASLLAFATAQTNPISKVLQLLSDLQTKVIREGEDAQKTYAEFSELCEDRSRTLDHEIKTGQGEADELNAAIAKSVASVGALQTKVEQLSGEITVNQADLRAAKEIRMKEAKSFTAEESELTEVISTLRRAVGILEREMKKGGSHLELLKNAGSLTKAMTVLVQGSMLSTSDADRLASLVQSRDDDEDDGAPPAPYYKGHSNDIIDVLGDLLEKAEDQLEAARKKETQAKHAFELLAQSLNDEIKFGEKELHEAKMNSAALSERKASAEGDLQMTTKELEGDKKALAELHHECMTKAQDFEAETKSRGEELKALAEAKRVIKESTSGAEDQSYGSEQASFLQLTLTSSITTSVGLAQFEATRLIRDLARKEHSRELMLLASRMASVIRASASAGEDPFAKVKTLIQAMIERLESDADKDSTHKAFCDTELVESKAKHADKTAEIQKLGTNIDRMMARSAQLKEEIAALQKGLAELAASQAEMDKIRRAEKEAFGNNKVEMEQGLQGVKMALKILNEYYAKQDKAHAAAEGAGSSIIGLLEVVESDLTKGLAEMTATEETAQMAFEQETRDNSIERATKEQDVKYKTKESTGLDQATSEATSDRAGVQAELDAVQEYLRKIEAQCIAKAETYNERKARYEAELAGLREALHILENETALLQRSSKQRLGFLGRTRSHSA